jgi:dipeptidyl aminopeptidase/acylaminoacyl peptidase
MRIHQHIFFTLALLLGCWSAGYADGLAPAREGMTALDVAHLKSVGGFHLSPDGRYIAYQFSVPRRPDDADFKNGPADPELHIYDLKSKTDRVFITGDDKLRGVQWTPDSRHLSFLSKRKEDKTTSLYTIPIDGGEGVKRLSWVEDITAYSIAPDGRRVAFLAKDKKPESVEKREKLGFDQEVFEEDWLSTRLYLTTLDTDTSGLKPLPIEGHLSEVSWSPKAGDDRLLVVVAPNPGVDASLVYRRLHVVDGKGGVLASFNNPGKLGSSSWSPDGAWVAYAAGVDKNDPDESGFFVANSKTGIGKDLMAGVEARVESFAWKSPGELVAAMSVGADSKLVSITTAGGRKDLPGSRELNYLEVDVTESGNVVVGADSWRHPRELFVNGQRITDSNPWLKDRALARQELISHNARDGLRLEGVLVYPLEGTASGPAPLIMCVHGGPEAHVDDGWVTGYSNPGQVAAAQGYAVFYPNYRGSTGRGVTFAKTSQGDAAGKEFDDLIDAIDYLVEKGIADKSKVGVTGGSYGGYATAWLSTRHSERVAAGVMFVGISDKVSKVGTTDIPDEEYLVHARKRPWENFDFFAERSPIRYVEKARTPLLIMHGKDDPRVHPTQSMELFRFLKVLGQTPVRLVLYPGEGHGNRKAAARYDYNLRMMQWFDHYLKGPGGDKPAPELEYDLKALESKS